VSSLKKEGGKKSKDPQHLRRGKKEEAHTSSFRPKRSPPRMVPNAFDGKRIASVPGNGPGCKLGRSSGLCDEVGKRGGSSKCAQPVTNKRRCLSRYSSSSRPPGPEKQMKGGNQQGGQKSGGERREVR